MALLFVSDFDDPVAWQEALAKAAPDLEFRVWPEAGDVNDIEVALVWQPPPGLLASLPRLRLVQSLGAGIDHLLADPQLPRTVPIARLVDPSLTRQMVTYVLLAALDHHRDMAAYRSAQAKGKWQPVLPQDPTACRIGVMGQGAIGAAAAQAFAALEFDVAGWSRSPKSVPGVSGYHGVDGLDAFLTRSDILVCLLPLTAETAGILDARLFAALPAGAYVINAARGAHMVDADLLAALESGHLSGAWLDVFHSEPLPADNPLWRHPAITLTPHIGGWVLPSSAATTIVENLRKARAGEPIDNILDLTRGY
ncbi:MAG: glyoxylate/hydroxypyruvate reductase A [Alphaproteobacteria bacterium]|jgi:glyoxylate/hydroxypyruvate reductase A|nr:glyoxylate/hydroxypyruvate reductase A [Alphaproteobacteria bacterium]